MVGAVMIMVIEAAKKASKILDSFNLFLVSNHCFSLLGLSNLPQKRVIKHRIMEESLKNTYRSQKDPSDGGKEKKLISRNIAEIGANTISTLLLNIPRPTTPPMKIGPAIRKRTTLIST